jgi:hypothetical protein
MRCKLLIIVGILFGLLALLFILAVPAAPLLARLGIKPICIQGNWTRLRVVACQGGAPANADVPHSIAPDGDQVMALVHGTLIDGTGAPPLRDAAIVIRQGRIVAVGASAQVKLPDGRKSLMCRGTSEILRQR